MFISTMENSWSEKDKYINLNLLSIHPRSQISLIHSSYVFFLMLLCTYYILLPLIFLGVTNLFKIEDSHGLFLTPNYLFNYDLLLLPSISWFHLACFLDRNRHLVIGLFSTNDCIWILGYFSNLKKKINHWLEMNEKYLPIQFW